MKKINKHRINDNNEGFTTAIKKDNNLDDDKRNKETAIITRLTNMFMLYNRKGIIKNKKRSLHREKNGSIKTGNYLEINLKGRVIQS